MKKKSLAVRICSVSLFIALFCFFIIGHYLKKNGVEYAYGWASISFSLVILLPFILGVKKISFPIVIVIIYLILGFVWGLWHPWWVLFLLIPIFYAIFPKHYFEHDEDDDDDDDDDDHHKHHENVINEEDYKE